MLHQQSDTRFVSIGYFFLSASVLSQMHEGSDLFTALRPFSMKSSFIVLVYCGACDLRLCMWKIKSAKTAENFRRNTIAG